jgi:Restriction endonuclease BglII
VKIIAEYSHKEGSTFIRNYFASELTEIVAAVEAVSIDDHRTKETKETGSKFQPGQMLFSPVSMNKAIYAGLKPLGWRAERIAVTSPLARGGGHTHTGFREMDGLKNGLGLEIQFGKYAFMGYDILGKMPIFHRKGLIRAGIELVPTKEIAIGNMSSGVSYFEQIIADLELRGEADVDIPTLILGIGFKQPPSTDKLERLGASTDGIE